MLPERPRLAPSIGSRRHIRALAGTCAFTLVVLLGAEDARREFDLPRDFAVRTFKLFSEQSGRGLIADAEMVRAIKTNAVRGRFSLHEVLARMLAGTGLAVREDPKNGAFVVHRTEPAGGALRPRAAELPERNAR